MEFDPPIPLSIAARRTWDRLADRIYKEGRWPAISQEMLGVFCQTLHLYLECLEQIDRHGVLVEGRTPRELVRNPALTPMNQSRAALVHLARSVPLINAHHDHSGAAVDAYIDSLLADGS
jgi:P27 family predicted phage terminase small subunit